MSGSLTWREYTSDHGTIYSIQIDKSNAKLRNSSLGEDVCSVRGFTWDLPPKTLTLRRIHCVAQFNLNIRRSFICGNPKIINNPAIRIGGDYLVSVDPTLGSEAARLWIITGYTGEKFTPPKFYNQLDSGLDDGTSVDN